MKNAKLSVRGLSLGLGVLCALIMLVWGLMVIWFGLWTEVVPTVASFYKGFDPTTYLGILIGMVYGFLDGLIGGALIAWLYNFFARK